MVDRREAGFSVMMTGLCPGGVDSELPASKSMEVHDGNCWGTACCRAHRWIKRPWKNLDTLTVRIFVVRCLLIAFQVYGRYAFDVRSTGRFNFEFSDSSI